MHGYFSFCLVSYQWYIFQKTNLEDIWRKFVLNQIKFPFSEKYTTEIIIYVSYNGFR